MQFGKVALGLAAALAMGIAGETQATTLFDLNGGQSLTVGGLTFSDFSISVTGSALDPNLKDYKVLTQSDGFGPGFRITGPFAAVDNEQGDMLVSYDVSVAAGTPAVNDMRLAFNGAAPLGPNTAATVSEDLFAIPSGDSIADASVFAIAGGSSKKVDTETFAPQTSFSVEKDILLKAGAGGLATISFVDQHFSLVPEPGSLALLGGGLAGLLVLGRKRNAR